MAQAIQRILHDSNLAARMAQASLAIAEPHGETHTFDRYEDVYRHTIAASLRYSAPRRPASGLAGLLGLPSGSG
jgi:hypothetical protein